MDLGQESYPYQAQTTKVSMGGCYLEAGEIYLVVVYLNTSAQGSAAVEELPGSGGQVSFYPEGMRIEEIAVGCSD